MGRFFILSFFIVNNSHVYLGLAGLRVGYSISDPILASYMMAIKQPYNINVAADVGARATLSNLEEAMKRVKSIKFVLTLHTSYLSMNRDEREKLKEEITNLFGKWMHVYPSEANFLLIKGIF
jgi:histidinol-phosphate/aromatic aminotransferase/cobyric acid decarboxylase-like protein